jgi:heme/copper-type cytochrome/quinol oxidase subunit 4
MKPTSAARRRRKMRKGFFVISALAVITAIEFWVAVAFAGNIELLGLLLAIAAVKCWFIVDYFMHISRLWLPEEN